SSGAQASGIMKIVDGGVVYESSTSKGKMTFHESQDGKAWIWKWDGMTPDGRYVRNVLTKSKRTPPFAGLTRSAPQRTDDPPAYRARGPVPARAGHPAP